MEEQEFNKMGCVKAIHQSNINYKVERMQYASQRGIFRALILNRQ